MKKILYVVAFATFALVSCHDKNAPENQKESNVLTFKASIEALATDANAGNRSAESASTGMAKATINSDNALVWATNDLIGIYFPDFGDKNQPFRLDPADDGKTEGSFAIATEANPSGASATVAYFPYQYSGTRTEKNYPNYPSSSQNNVFDKDDGNGPVMYFKMPDEYWSYDNEKMLTPLIASISSSSDDISFKHAGAAVKLTINNLAGGTYKVKMSVEDKQITGDFHINPANAGTDALALDAAENTALNHITLNTWKSSGAFSWIFPVPTLTAPELSFEIVDNNGITVWSKSPKFAQKNVGRAQLLVMPALSISPYSQFDANATWGVCGDHNSWGDTKMITDGSLCIAKGVTFAANDQFKVRTLGGWTTSYGWDQLNTSKSVAAAVAGTENNNIKISTAGTYDIIFNSSDSEYSGYGAHEIRVVSSSFPYPIPKVSVDITIDGSFADWSEVTPESNGNTTVKIASDDSYIYVYVQRTNASGDYNAIWGGVGYVYIRLDYDNDWTTNGSGVIYDNYGDFVGLLYPYAGSSESPAFQTSAASSWKASPSPSTVDNVTLAGVESSGTATFECRIPRADIPTVPTTTIGIKVHGNKGMSGATFSREL